MQNIDSLLERFAYLDARFSRGRGAAGKLFSQMELFYLAQAICSYVAPEIQHQLDAIRREVMDEVVQGPKGIGAIVAPRRHSTSKWSDFQITPEFSTDISSTGRFVSSCTTHRLVHLHKLQVKAVIHAVEGWKRINSQLNRD